MSELLANEGVETLSMRVARRLRGAIAENRIVQRDLAAAAGIPQPQMSRRITGFTPFTLDELERIAYVLGIELDALLGTGAWEGRSIGLCAIRDSNPEPADSKPRADLLTLVRPAVSIARVATIRTQPARVSASRHLYLVDGAA